MSAVYLVTKSDAYYPGPGDSDFLQLYADLITARAAADTIARNATSCSVHVIEINPATLTFAEVYTPT